MNKPMKRKMSRRQDGVALVVGLVLLLVLTMIGLSAVRTSTSQERMAAGYQVQSQTFQTAESSLRLVLGQLSLQPGVDLSLTPAYVGTSTINITTNTDLLSIARSDSPLTPRSTTAATPPATGVGIIPLKYSQVAADGTGFSGVANLYFTGNIGAKISGNSMGRFSAFSYEINGLAQQPSVGTRVNNIISVWFLVPRQQGF